MTLTQDRESLFQTTIQMSKTAKYANTMNTGSKSTELFSTSVTVAYKCTVLKMYVFKMDFGSCPVMKAFKCDVTKIKQEKKIYS